jgi:hypothetical protein
MKPIRLKVNGQHRTVNVDSDLLLLFVLSDELGLRGPRFGCGMPDGHGINSAKCNTCHQDRNLAGAHMPPGSPDWHLPPPDTPMIREGLTDSQLCELLKDPKQNGNRSIDQIVAHMSTPLVLWGWNPGDGRTPILMKLSEFQSHLRDWAANGAACLIVKPGGMP